MECPNCGSTVAAGSNFCPNCGEKLTRPSGLTGDTTKVISVVTDTGTHVAELSAEDQAAAEALPSGHALLIVERGPDAGARYLLDADVITAGRHPKSDIFLDDITVSRHHAEFTRGDNAWLVADKGSLNGTYVNRTLVDGTAQLRQGDEVQVGKYRMVFFVSEHGLR